jgi:hypothetical protein
MTSPTQPKSTPIPALLVYGTPTSPELTQASWFRAEDKQAAKAAAEVLKFSVIDIQTEADRALTVGVHEGVLKGSGRMIVGSVSSEVYRRIENYVARVAGAEASPKPTSSEAAATRPASEQNMNQIPAAHAAATSDAVATSPDAKSSSSASFLASAKNPPTSPEGEPQSLVNPAAASSSKPENTSAAPPDPWDALRVGSHVVGKYWQKDGTAYGWWIGVITGIDKNDFIIRWPDEPKTPPLKIEREHVAILHPAYDVTRERQRRR